MRRSIRCAAPPIAVLAVALVAGPLWGQSRGQSQATRHRDIVRLMDEAEMTLAKAVEAAEKECGGRAVGARADVEGEKLVFTVQCSVGDELKPVMVDKHGKATIRGAKKDAKDADKGKPDDNDPRPRGGDRDTPRPRQP